MERMTGRAARPILMMLLACALTLTTTSAPAATQIGPVTVTNFSIYSGASGTQAAVVYFSPAASPLPEGCSSGNAVWIDFSSSAQPDGKSLYATVMAAFTSGRTVNFGVSGCADAGALPVVYRVDVNAS